MKTTIIGYEKEVQELQKVINIINDSNNYLKKGIKLPKGLLIRGHSGNGKSLFSRYFVENINKQIFKIKISDLGSNYPESIHHIYKKANEVEGGSIVIIDELDKLLGDQESYQGIDFKVFSELLQELDQPNQVFTVLMAISDHIIPSQLIRSGRIDITINLHSPNEEERISLLKHYIKPFEYNDNDIQYIAHSAQSLSCAEIENLSKLASMNAMVDNKNIVTIKHLESAFNQIIFKGIPKKNTLTQDQLKRVAVHEIGHALMAHHLSPEKLQTISIEHYEQTLGHVRLRSQNQPLLTETEYKNHIYIGLAGRALEKLYIGETSTGSSRDLEHVYNLLKSLITKYSFQDFEYLKIDNHEGNYKPISDKKRQKMELKIISLMKVYENYVNKILKNYLLTVPKIVNTLLEKTIIYRHEFQEILEQKN